jgi:uncharacterized damage-inducible protein DinB
MLIERYRRWYAYERDCNDKVMRVLREVPESQHATDGFGRATMLLAHQVAARQMWLFRLGAAPEKPREFFPENVPLPELARRLAAIEAAWASYLDGLDDAELERVFEYRSVEGDAYRGRVEDILTQLFGHAWYHRGQIATSLRSIGTTPPATDFVYWTREPVAVPPRG